ncbi:hypothetical protein PAXRUDRAFT_697394 [Paxillus rubicundulus Ve08.2h10]|uniref:Unplaced genomic scaffold scaffold_75, whole genome shotgun sequence n=1 Tax=Paxillus rubicundulus Ve08.2h10 TaxID=930991 RepID=A0A0D0DIX5_9AGAM|nr:hypothetical protein PAXRUDRAFT_697394 [Paxillus rubicundulus Ve08.2h10]
MNARKRKASDHLLPTTQTKHSRTEKLRTKEPPGMLAVLCQGMQDGWNHFCRKSMPLLPPIDEHDASQVPPLPPNRQVHTTPAPHPAIPPRLPIPSEFHSHKPEARSQHSNLPSSFPSNSNSMKTLNSSNTSPQSATSTEMTSISSKPASLPRHHTMDATLEEYIRISRTTEQSKKAYSHTRTRPHIYHPHVCIATIV